MNYTEMLFNRDERLVNLLNQADSKNLELIEEINKKEDEIDRLNNIIKELSKDVDMWNKKYNEQFNIINELENFINNEIFTSLDKKHVFNEEADTFYKVLDKLKTLKENNK